jgi:hypothetical protein
MTQVLAERGSYNTVVFTGSEAIKTSHAVFETYSEAEQQASDLRGYAQLLGAEPLRTTALLDAGPIKEDDGYHLRHTYERITGVPIADVRDEQQHTAVRTVLGWVAGMSTAQDENILAVPVDLHKWNVLVDTQGPVAIDMHPALTRLPDGSFPLGRIGPRWCNAWPAAMGTKTGVMTKIVSSVIERGDTPLEKLGHILRRTDDWCYDALPADLPSHLKRPLERQIRNHFIPYMAMMARHRAAQKAGKALRMLG